MNFVYLTLAAFFAGLSLGYVKFYFLSYLSISIYPPGNKEWIIQTVGALITFGPCLAYVLSGPIASSCYKYRIMKRSALLAAFVLIVGFVTNWIGTGWLYVFLVGLIMGIFNPAKNAAIPLESVRSGKPTEYITAVLSITYITGILAGAPLATKLYISASKSGALISIVILILAATFGGLCSYSNENSHLRSFRESLKELLGDTQLLIKDYWVYVFAAPMIWGMASAESLAVTAYAEERMLGGPVKCSLMAVYATLGVILGNFFSTKLIHVRYLASLLSSIGIVLIILAIPAVVNFMNPSQIVGENRAIYTAVAVFLGLLGILFGIVTNLLEAEYLRLIYREKKEGTGAALLSALTAFFPFIFGGVIAIAIIFHLANLETQFIGIAGISLVPSIFIWLLWRANRNL